MPTASGRTITSPAAGLARLGDVADPHRPDPLGHSGDHRSALRAAVAIAAAWISSAPGR